jgi:hypothetical protein
MTSTITSDSLKAKYAFLVDQSSCLPHDLALAVIHQSGEWEMFAANAPDIASHGADCGFNGWTWDGDMVAFAKENRAAIAAAVENMADQLGQCPLSMVQQFRCVGTDWTLSEIGRALYGDSEEPQLMTALSWFCVEELARAYVDHLER